MKRLASCLMAIGVLAGGASQASGIRVAGVDHVGINVPDLKQAEAFFDSAFGCEPVTRIGPFQLDPAASADAAGFAPRADSVTIAMLRCAEGSNIEMFEYRNPHGNKDMPRAEDIGASHIAFYTDDIEGAVSYLKANGITVLGEPVKMTSGDTEGETWVHFRSPWGSDMELVSYPNGKGYERRSSLRLWNPKHPGQ